MLESLLLRRGLAGGTDCLTIFWQVVEQLGWPGPQQVGLGPLVHARWVLALRAVIWIRKGIAGIATESLGPHLELAGKGYRSECLKP